MKKMWIIAVIVCSALVISCGDKNKNSENKGGEQSDAVFSKMTFTDPVEIKTAELANRLVAALKAGDEALAYQISAEAAAYEKTLSDLDRKSVV